MLLVLLFFRQKSQIKTVNVVKFRKYVVVVVVVFAVVVAVIFLDVLFLHSF